MRAALVALVAGVVLFAGCASDADEFEQYREPDGSLNINLTEQDFINDFYTLSLTERIQVCEEWWDQTEEEFDEMMWDMGYSYDQTINSWNALVEVCQ